MAMKALPIIGVFAVVLVAIGVVMVTQNKGSDKSQSGDINSSEKTVKEVCQQTRYNKTCVETLSKSNSSDPKTLAQLSLRMAMEEVTGVLKQLASLRQPSDSQRASSAFEICQNFLNGAIMDLERTQGRMDTFGTDEYRIILDDINIWLSGSLTYMWTCLESLEEAEANATGKVRELLQPAREIAINGFGLVEQFNKLIPHLQEGRILATMEKEQEHKQLRNNPKGLKPHVTVAQDGSGKYRSITEAMQEIPRNQNDTFMIYVKEGVYHEYLNFTSDMRCVMLVGDGPTKTKITGNRAVGDTKTNTFLVATVSVSGDGFIGKDIGFENTAGGAMHQAPAILVNGDRVVFYNCIFDSNQDTLLTHMHRQFYRDCTIIGTVDFIFGEARAVFQNCTLIVRKPFQSQKCMVTAHGRDDPAEDTGYAILSSRILPAADYPLDDKNTQTFLGRPWRNFSRTVILDSEIDGFINSEGWSEWKPKNTTYLETCFYAEANNFGDGANLANRVKMPGIKNLSSKEADNYTVGIWLDENWIKGLGIPYNAGRFNLLPRPEAKEDVQV